MRFSRKALGSAGRVGILSGAFHPMTRAHLALARAALETFETEEVLFVLPEEFPHKTYEGVTLAERLEMVDAATREERRFSIGVAAGGLFLEIARECREAYGQGVRLRFLCGRDTAERIVGWDYGGHPAIGAQLQEYELLVAPRQGVFSPPEELAGAIGHLPVEWVYDAVSSTEVRGRIARGEAWEHLVPDAIVARVRELYASLAAGER